MSTKPIDWKTIADIYSNGGFDVNIARELDITIADFYRLEQEQPAFAKFVEKGRTMSQAWWYDQCRKNLTTKGFNTTLYNFVMKNTQGWADKTDIQDTTDKDPVNLDAAKSQLQQALKRVAQSNPEIVSGLRLIQGGDKKANE